jgi:pantetheine-phosphate adenylyltransferase
MSARPRKVGVFPGQFDPITNGHLDVILRGAQLFDELVVAVSNNPDKREFFTMAERVETVRELVQLQEIPHVRVEPNPGLTFKFAESVRATALLRGIRDASDLRGEFQTAMANRSLSGIETVFIMTGDQYALTSSSLIRQVVGLGGDVRSLAGLLPALVIQRLRQKQRQGGLALQEGADLPVG